MLLLRWKEALSVEGEMLQISPDDLASILGWWAMVVDHTAVDFKYMFPWLGHRQNSAYSKHFLVRVL